MRHQRYLTLNGIEVKSFAECELANFFFAHNIAFRYEAQVTWLPEGTRYRPDWGHSIDRGRTYSKGIERIENGCFSCKKQEKQRSDSVC